MQGTQVTDIEKKEDYPQFKRGYKISKQISEKEGNHPNTHIETYYVLYDMYGPIGEYKSEKEAIKEMKAWYIDPELYPDGEAGLHIEKEDHEVYNEVIHVKDPLA